MTRRDKHLFEVPGKIFSVLLILFVFLFSIDLMVVSLEHLGQETIRSLMGVTANPFVSLFIGLLVTAIVQSSSTTTSIIVAMVASGSLDLSNAIPMVMGANIGTTITSDLVSLSFIARRLEFRRAITIATAHDFFNIFTVIIFFPLQYYFNFLGELSNHISSFFGQINHADDSYLFTMARNMPVSDWFFNLIGNKIIALVVSVMLLFAAIKYASRITQALMIGDSRNRFANFIFTNPFKSFSWGVLVTAAMQSSSVTTSLLVPMAASGRVKVKNAFPFILGANIGTTITALLAALFKNEAAIGIAIIHLVFNFLGVLIFLPFKSVRNIPVFLAKNLGAATLRHRIVGFIYIIITFFLLPFGLILLSR